MGASRQDYWKNRKVLVTGHTGFKGGWLSIWLTRLGAQVTGIGLPPATQPALYELAEIGALVSSHFQDIRDLPRLRETMLAAQPEVVFHLAAQPLVRASYRDPIETWSTNVMGTAHVLEAVRTCPSVKAVVVVTTDKCYENREWPWGYRENDTLGGHDPYSASKAGSELVVCSYRRSFFSADGPLLASARAGNVIGGGDWSEDRLIPDAARAMLAGQPLSIRSPDATRPWQHVLEPLNGYLLLAEHLLAGEARAAEAFNFGPEREGNRSVIEVLGELQRNWPELQINLPADGATPTLHEANFLYLDSSKAWNTLGWKPVWTLGQALSQTATWYQAVATEPTKARTLCVSQIEEFMLGLTTHGTH
ncbi:CDP-glucose 4,6-dehydratase [Denitratisoma oestradiolicum]|uniref:CDP-glucose 4,6-dehydratase n=1 Tax=Denitratisoma oestradiolicum TaxID=311182 RepID=A0A6S6Y1V4_9PROT|nr:CDP-glucose 4,6-dehydratase [Denitratisoma oestradiolicum]TWO78852.1 CDP-glucose 4,6-dehydratase [Denitratisoma oestradiolicum]CAB1370495.1 CDP-glucose 4,6-dehydratase [Denitratisoma oestradiolicum]